MELMERRLEVHLPFLWAQGAEDAQHLSPEHRAGSCCFSRNRISTIPEMLLLY